MRLSFLKADTYIIKSLYIEIEEYRSDWDFIWNSFGKVHI
jgi:hypothetical protein